MYQTIQEFIEDWKLESEYTLKLFRAMNDASLKQQVYEEGRSLGRVAWHITYTIAEMMGHSGLEMGNEVEEDEVPTMAKTMVKSYEQLSLALVEQLRAQWTDAMLQEAIELYGEMWDRSKVLDVLIRHQAHHRGQMTVLMRQAGRRVPGIYGPAREEWAEMDLQPRP